MLTVEFFQKRKLTLLLIVVHVGGPFQVIDWLALGLQPGPPGKRWEEKPAPQLAAEPLGRPRSRGSDITTKAGRLRLSLPRP